MRIRERLPVSTEMEVKALDHPHSCPECERSFATTRGLAVHRARWCRLEQRPATRRDQLVDNSRHASEEEDIDLVICFLHAVVMEGELLESGFQKD